MGLSASQGLVGRVQRGAQPAVWYIGGEPCTVCGRVTERWQPAPIGYYPLCGACAAGSKGARK